MTHGGDEEKEVSKWAESQGTSENSGDWEKGTRGIYSEHGKSLHPRQARAIEAHDLCYDCETGFHYMK
ncbi:hypothetical protein Desaci_2620 [Desulfosporosinus acidiphilus SJ4]|uniref:Uncharacterized protein n=1 Tax=Desulfosporosinus acidiphilus (strain DSM 22704 / JCM 16185 / SJ4) TaxID=646529 RepID=I4D6X9_DESAJ|nr:hypothetical protein [Desulfosporosinus acidiphilus]AFM41553.1 hypothetical protein Desaci_2620 [Desulfosporosinus acidiphilus SJ4]